jgi:putative transposase
MGSRARQLEFVIRRHGGRRAGAGRKASGRHNVSHSARTPHDRHAPVHATLRAAALPASLRAPAVFAAVRVAIAKASRSPFRIIAFSVQRDHLHLVVEADDTRALSRGLQGLSIRVAKAVNRVLGRRGAVWSDRYHARDLTSPRAVRNALVYVLQNYRKHAQDRGQRVDPCSSAPWFTGWKERVRTTMSSPVVTARTWLARWGWRRHGLLDPEERPRARRGPERGRHRGQPRGANPLRRVAMRPGVAPPSTLTPPSGRGRTPGSPDVGRPGAW